MASHATSLRAARSIHVQAGKPGLLLVPEGHAVPASFVEALKRGWTVVRETTVLGIDKRHRHGNVFLAKAGGSSLVVSYTGTIKQGYRFGKPELAN